MADEIVIDGDKVIAFTNAIKDLGKILDQVNIIDVKEAFLRGKSLGCVQNIIDTRDKWKQTLGEIGDGLKLNAKEIEASIATTKEMLAFMRPMAGFITSPQFDQAKTNLREFVELCDRLDKHRQSGTLDIVASLK